MQSNTTPLLLLYVYKLCLSLIGAPSVHVQDLVYFREYGKTNETCEQELITNYAVMEQYCSWLGYFNLLFLIYISYFILTAVSCAVL